MVKYKPSFNRDYLFYLENADNFNFAADYSPNIIKDSNGRDAKYCFWLLDSQGKQSSCSQPEELAKVLLCKKSINFHIKIWAEGYLNYGEPIDYYLQDFINPPDWVRVSLEKQIKKINQKNILSKYLFLTLDIIRDKIPDKKAIDLTVVENLDNTVKELICNWVNQYDSTTMAQD